MAINILNKFGPISFESSTLNFSSGSSINSLIENFISPGSQDFSLSASFSNIFNRIGNYNTDTKTNNIVNPLGTSLSNYDGKSSIKFSSFLNASYLSASIVQGNSGIVTASIFSPSTIITNNFFTGNSQDQVFKYILYTKPGTTTPISDTNWTKVYSYIKTGNNLFKFYDLINTNSYKIVVKDCLSNAFTSSMFVGNCTDTITNTNYYNFNVSSDKTEDL